MTRDELEALVRVEHVDPHAVLGPHEVDGGLLVRAFRPDAAGVTLLPDAGGAIEMARVHEAGVYEAFVAGAKYPLRYRLAIAGASGTETVRDPYAFPPALGAVDLHLAAEGTHLALHQRMGAHVREIDGVLGTAFAVWAPAARRVSVAGDFNRWDGRIHAMRRLGDGVWEIFLPEIGHGALYKFEVLSHDGLATMKSDPFARASQLRPHNASRVVERRFTFGDEAWMKARAEGAAKRKPLSIYEVHLGSWRLRPPHDLRDLGPDVDPKDPARRWLTYRELADQLVDYVSDMGFTHVELLPVMEHPYDGSWGYQITGYFSPTSRYGEPDDFRYFVDRCHRRGIGVLLDWAPAHFPKDAWALGRFDGTALYEHLDPRQGEHRQWQTYVFNYGRAQVKNFLLSSALYWLEEFHVDGLRVDAVASMLYLDFGTNDPNDWVPNVHGGRENLEAVALIRELADVVHQKHPGAILCAEESTTWPGVTKPTYVGGLGFDFKWNMGWMHDTLDYMKLDPIHRAFNHRLVTFGMMYAFSERFLLPFSHDEVVHLKKSLLSKMPGDDRALMHANLRTLFGYLWAEPGKKLLFMGGEIGVWQEWNEAVELDWKLLEGADHAGLQRLVRDLNHLYTREPALHEVDDDWDGFQWIDANDAPQSVISFLRFPRQPPAPPLQPGEARPAIPHRPKGKHVVFVANFTPVARTGYRVGVPRKCRYVEAINTDATVYGGGGLGNLGGVEAEAKESHGMPYSLVLMLPPLSALYFVPELADDPPAAAEA
jgi:1,4-alpha-glucan branching enzyme